MNSTAQPRFLTESGVLAIRARAETTPPLGYVSHEPLYAVYSYLPHHGRLARYQNHCPSSLVYLPLTTIIETGPAELSSARYLPTPKPPATSSLNEFHPVH